MTDINASRKLKGSYARINTIAS